MQITFFLRAFAKLWKKRLISSSSLSVLSVCPSVHPRKTTRLLLGRIYLSVCLSVCPSAWYNSALSGRIWMYFEIWRFFENLLRKFKFYYYVTNTMGSLHTDVSVYIYIYIYTHTHTHTHTHIYIYITSCWILLEWEIFHTKVVEKIKLYIYVYTFLGKLCRL